MGPSPYLARAVVESFPGEGRGGLRSLSAEATGSGREGTEAAAQVSRRQATGQPGPELIPQRREGGIPSSLPSPSAPQAPSPQGGHLAPLPSRRAAPTRHRPLSQGGGVEPRPGGVRRGPARGRPLAGGLLALPACRGNRGRPPEDGVGQHSYTLSSPLLLIVIITNFLFFSLGGTAAYERCSLSADNAVAPRGASGSAFLGELAFVACCGG